MPAVTAAFSQFGRRTFTHPANALGLPQKCIGIPLFAQAPGALTKGMVVMRDLCVETSARSAAHSTLARAIGV